MSITKFSSYASRERDRIRRLQKIKSQAASGRALANKIKMELGCCDCGYKANPLALQFDHRDQKLKRIEVSQAVKRSVSFLLSEISKCDVRCANCHAIRTAGLRQHLDTNVRKLTANSVKSQARLFGGSA